MHLTAKHLLLISASSFVIPMVLSFVYFQFFAAPLTGEVFEPSGFAVLVWNLEMIGSWTGVITFALALVSWKK